MPETPLPETSSPETPSRPTRGALTARLSNIAKPATFVEESPKSDAPVREPQDGDINCRLCGKALAPQSAYLTTTNRWESNNAAPLCISCVAKVRDKIDNQTHHVDWALGVAFGLLTTALLILVFGMAEANINIGTHGAPIRFHFYPFVAVLPAFLLGRVLITSTDHKRGWPVWVLGSLFLLLSVVGVEYIAHSAEFSDIGSSIPQFKIGFTFLPLDNFISVAPTKIDIWSVLGLIAGLAVLVLSTWPQRLYIRHFTPAT